MSISCGLCLILFYIDFQIFERLHLEQMFTSLKTGRLHTLINDELQLVNHNVSDQNVVSEKFNGVQ